MSNNSFSILIPARFAAARLPGKPLIDIAGKPMIQHVYERVLNCGAENVVIATDDARIETIAKNFGAPVCMTSILHESGTERIAEAVELMNYPDDAIVVNVQGDEPLIPLHAIRLVAEQLHANPAADVATLCSLLISSDEILDPNVVKVVFDKQGYALYFSRASIPFDRNIGVQKGSEVSSSSQYYGHIGIYAYRARYLKRYIQLPKSPFEQTESLEQLRVLWNGGKIYVYVLNEKFPLGINTSEDLEKVRKILQIQQ